MRAKIIPPFTKEMSAPLAEKVQRGIQRLRAFEPPDGYYFAFSGGKDSVAVKRLCDLAGVRYTAHYNVTTVDPPELVRFIRERYPDVAFEKPALSMRQLIIKKQFPPTRLQRYCCAEVKEIHGIGHIVVTGSRWAESARRKENQGAITLLTGKQPPRLRKKVEPNTSLHRTKASS